EDRGREAAVERLEGLAVALADPPDQLAVACCGCCCHVPILDGRGAGSHRGGPPDFRGSECRPTGTAGRRPGVVAGEIGRDTVTLQLQDATTRPAARTASSPAGVGELLERSGELTRIEAALAEARAGRGTFVVVEGPAGIGKTALIAAARAAATERGVRVLRSRGTELERGFAFGVVRQLFEPPLAEASERERAELLQASAGVAAGFLGLPGAATADGPLSSRIDPSFAILHGL